MPVRQLRRVRWAVRASLVLGVSASVAANILHAEPNPIAQTIAAWPPLALLLTVELISRIPVHRRSLAAVRLMATAAIAGIAAWVSYWHMAGVAARYGESGAAPYLLPLSVDGLVVVASVSLVELAGRIRAAEAELPESATPTAPAAAAPAVAPAPATAPLPAPAAAWPPAPPPARTRDATRTARTTPTARSARTTPTAAVAAPRLVEAKPAGGPAPIGATFAQRLAAGRSHPIGSRAKGRPVAETRRLAAELAAKHPDATPDELARTLGITTKRLKTVLGTAA